MLRVLFFLHFKFLQLIPCQILEQARPFFDHILKASLTSCIFIQGQPILAHLEKIEPESEEFRSIGCRDSYLARHQTHFGMSSARNQCYRASSCWTLMMASSESLSGESHLGQCLLPPRALIHRDLLIDVPGDLALERCHSSLLLQSLLGSAEIWSRTHF